MKRNRSNRFNRRFLAAILVIAALALSAPAAGLAQSVNPTDDQYGPPTLTDEGSGGPSSSGGGGSSGTVSTESVGELPFTGLDVAAIAAIGIGLAGGGFVIRRAARAGDDRG